MHTCMHQNTNSLACLDKLNSKQCIFRLLSSVQPSINIYDFLLNVEIWFAWKASTRISTVYFLSFHLKSEFVSEFIILNHAGHKYVEHDYIWTFPILVLSAQRETPAAAECMCVCVCVCVCDPVLNTHTNKGVEIHNQEHLICVRLSALHFKRNIVPFEMFPSYFTPFICWLELLCRFTFYIKHEQISIKCQCCQSFISKMSMSQEL